MLTLPTTESQASAPPAPPAAGGGRIAALDGLRGLAVTLVVVYHFAPQVLPAGFLGVDVFFVLSGFLITTLALAEHDRSGTLRVRAFFLRRARRLLPAAVATVVVVTLVSVLLQPAAARQPLRGQAVASLLYGANWWSIGQGDSYQAAFGAESPLNHFWSLAVEEQFYLLFPLVILGLAFLVARRGADRRRLAVWLLGVSAVGALASARLMAQLHDPLADPSRVYLGSDTRAQAVLVGVAAACGLHLWRAHLATPAVRRGLLAAGSLGAALVLWAAVAQEFRSGWLYQGGFLLVALSAGAVTLAAAVGGSPLSRGLEGRALCVLGAYSYGIYLWHWPVRVLLDEGRTGLDGVALFALRVAVTAALTVASARLVEAPFRHPRPRRAAEADPPWGPAALRLTGVAAALLVVLVLAAPVARPAGDASTTAAPVVPAVPGAGTPSSSPDATVGPVALAPPGTDPGPTRIGPAVGPVKVLWEGDSVAWTLAGGDLIFPQPTTYTSPFDDQRVAVWNKATYKCPLLDVVSRTMGEARRGSACADRTADWTAAMAAFRPDVVSWSGALRDLNDVQVDGRWLTFGTPEWDAAYRDGLAGLRDLATAHGAALLLLGQPDADMDPGELYEEGLLPPNLWRWGHLRDLQRAFAAEHPDDTRYVDLQATLCPTGTCPATTADGSAWRVDHLHFSAAGSQASGPAVTEAVEVALGRAASAADPTGAAGPTDPAGAAATATGTRTG